MLIKPLHSGRGTIANWLNDGRNGREATRILTRHLKIDDTLAVRTYRYMLIDGKAYRGEAKVDGPGLAEMIRMLAEANVIPQKEPWQSFVLEFVLKLPEAI